MNGLKQIGALMTLPRACAMGADDLATACYQIDFEGSSAPIALNYLKISS